MQHTFTSLFDITSRPSPQRCHLQLRTGRLRPRCTSLERARWSAAAQIQRSTISSWSSSSILPSESRYRSSRAVKIFGRSWERMGTIITMTSGKHMANGDFFTTIKNTKQITWMMVNACTLAIGTCRTYEVGGYSFGSISNSWMRSHSWILVSDVMPIVRKRPSSTAIGTNLSAATAKSDAPMRQWMRRPVRRVSVTLEICSERWPSALTTSCLSASAKRWLMERTVAAHIHGRPSIEETKITTERTARSRWYPGPFLSRLSALFMSRAVMFWSRKRRTDASRAGAMVKKGRNCGTAVCGASAMGAHVCAELACAHVQLSGLKRYCRSKSGKAADGASWNSGPYAMMGTTHGRQSLEGTKVLGMRSLAVLISPRR
mmetsp:Transcript_655/g.1481  ORF Transcript_655/g.1481 Transcript_655/m.1481 type:complete len:375 (+) Transcript_655:352-1476(+)